MFAKEYFYRSPCASNNPEFQPQRWWYAFFLKNLFYFFFGRYTGLLFYMAPGLLFLTLFLLSDRS